jgi:hypothetical protein
MSPLLISASLVTLIAGAVLVLAGARRTRFEAPAGRGSARYFVGRREDRGPVAWIVDRRRVERLRGDVAAADLGWGCTGGPADRLAVCILAEVTGSAPSGALVAAFARDVVGRLPFSGFVLPDRAVYAWLTAAAPPTSRTGVSR